MTTAAQLDRASAIVLGQVVASRQVGHKELVPPVLVRPETKLVKCDAIEKTLKVWQVLKGPSNLVPEMKVETYEFIGVPGLMLTSEPAIFFLTREGTFWRPASDFGAARIGLSGFPQRSLALKQFPNGPSLKMALIEALLDPHNAAYWPSFDYSLNHLIDVSYNLAGADGILKRDPAFMTQHLIALSESPNPNVAEVARRRLLLTTGFCNETRPIASEFFPTLARKAFLAGRLYQQPGESPAEQDFTYWQLKAYSCSKMLDVRQKANMLLRRYFPDRRVVSCEVCAEVEARRSGTALAAPPK